MATCHQVCTSALRKLGMVSEGRPAPRAYDMQTAMGALQGWYDGAMVAGLFGRLVDVRKEVDYEAKEFERVFNVSAGDLSFTLPEVVVDADSGEERMPLDLCPIILPASTGPLNYIFDATIGAWVGLFDLTVDTDAPLSSRGVDSLACLLAVQMAEEYGKEPGPLTTGRATRFLTTINQRNGSARRAVQYDYY